jgi:tRNA pseudouridine13 synthase
MHYRLKANIKTCRGRFELPTYSLGGCRPIHARLPAQNTDDFPFFCEIIASFLISFLFFATMYKIKLIPEDFIVEEENFFKLDDSGRYLLFVMEKQNYDTIKAISAIARLLKIPSKLIGFAGNKDKNAITKQYISIEVFRNITKERTEQLKLKDITLTYIGRIEERICLGNLAFNKFKITVRNLDSGFILDKKKLDKIPNYFGEQRFSINNSEIGKSVIKGDFKTAVELILKTNSEEEDRIKDFLKNSPADYVGAFRIIPKKMQQFYIHSYQSYLWNTAAERFLSKSKKSKRSIFPLLGFDTEFPDENIRKIYEELISDENIALRDFVIRKIPHLTVEGGSRPLFLNVYDFKNLKLEEDELNKGKKKIVLYFRLDKSCYATTVLKFLFE